MCVLESRKKFRLWLGLAAGLCASVALVGCETTVDPILETARPFTVYGYFTTGADTQSAVVIPIRGKLDPGDPQAPIDAKVQSENLTTGEVVPWRDSVVVYENGRFAHVFWVPFRAEAEHHYRLTVSRSDGRKAKAVVKVPTDPVATVEEPLVTGVRLLTQTVIWKPVIRLLRIEVAYHITVGPAGLSRHTSVIEYGGEPSGNSWAVNVQLSEDLNTVREQIGEGGGSLTLTGIEMRVFSVNNLWNPPGGTFDYELLAQPGTMSNVENGFGFVGAGVADTVRWRPKKEIRKLLGYN